MKKSWKDDGFVKAGLTAFIVIAISILFYMGLSHLGDVGDAIGTIFGVLTPFFVGIALAYILSPLYDLVEKPLYRLFAGKKSTPRRFAKAASKGIASTAAILVLLALVAGLLGMVIPQMVDSISRLIATMPEKTEQFMNWLAGINAQFSTLFKADPNMEEWIWGAIADASDSLTQWMRSMLLNLDRVLASLTNGVIGVLSTLLNIGIGIIICVYVLNSKRLFAAQCKKLVYSLFKTNTANYIVDVTRYIHRTFGGFISGKLIDSLLIGILCFIGMSILQIPYALLLSAVVGLFNIIPVFGPIISAAVGALLLLLEDPLKALFFLIFAIVLQQLDGNVIGPKILGESTGLSSFWVMFAILVGGGLFGFAGVLLGVPTFAVVYAFVNRYLERRLQKKHMSDHTDDYHDLNRIDEQTGEPLYGLEKIKDVPVRSSDKEQL